VYVGHLEHVGLRAADLTGALVDESENGKVKHENEHELTEYREFQKRINSNKIMSNTQSVYKNLIQNTDPQCITINMCHGDKFRVQERRLINLVSFIREKKERRGKFEMPPVQD
jgi:hypothetical protein